MLIGRPTHFVQGTYSSLSLASGTASTDADYALTSLIDPLVPAKYLWCTDSPIVAVRATWDHGAAVRIDGVSLGKHNFDAALDVRVQRHSSNVWTAPTQDAALPIAANHADGFSTSPFVDLRAVTGYSASGFRYTSIYIPVNSVAPKVGGLRFIQEFDEVDQTFERSGLRRGERRASILSLETEADVERYYRRRVKRRYLSGHLLATVDDLAFWVDLARETDGPYTPFLCILDPTVTSDGALLVRFSGDTAKDLEWGEDYPQVKPITVDLLEVSRGLPL